MRKLLGLMGIVVLGTSCMTTPKVYRAPFYSMNKREPVYIERSDTSFIYSDAQLERSGDIVTAIPDKRVRRLYALDSALFRQLKVLKFRPEIVEKGWNRADMGLLITYKDYWVGENDPSFYRFWLKGMSLKDSANIIVYEGVPLPATASKPDPVKEVAFAVAELTIPGQELFVDESDVYTVEDEQLLPRSKYYGAVSVGLAKRFGTTNSNLLPSDAEHRDQLNSGMSFSADLSYFLRPNYGLGVSYYSFRSKTVADSINFETGLKAKELSDQVNITFLGPAFYVRNLFFQGRLSTLISASGGYLAYQNNQVFTETGYANTMNSSGFGGKVGAGIDYIFHKNAGIGISAGLLVGRLSVTDETQPTDLRTEKISMSQLTLGVGLRIFL